MHTIPSSTEGKINTFGGGFCSSRKKLGNKQNKSRTCLTEDASLPRLSKPYSAYTLKWRDAFLAGRSCIDLTPEDRLQTDGKQLLYQFQHLKSQFEKRAARIQEYAKRIEGFVEMIQPQSLTEEEKEHLLTYIASDRKKLENLQRKNERASDEIEHLKRLLAAS